MKKTTKREYLEALKSERALDYKIPHIYMGTRSKDAPAKTALRKKGI